MASPVNKTKHPNARPGNENALKFKTPRSRKDLLTRYIRHCQEGLSDDSFEVAPVTLKRYIADFPREFPPEKVEKAKQARLLFWERLGLMGASGNLEGFNAASWIFNMKNRFNWRDKQDVTSGDEKLVGVQIYRPEKNKD